VSNRALTGETGNGLPKNVKEPHCLLFQGKIKMVIRGAFKYLSPYETTVLE